MLKCILIFNVLWLLSGCAINDVGLVKLRYFENDTILMISKESWGGYLSTDNTDAGLIFGHAERVFFYPKNENSIELSLDQLLTKVQQDQFIEITVNKEESVGEEPIAWITKNQGIMIHTNLFQFGVSLGVKASEVIRLPREFNGVFIFHSNSEGKFKAYFHEQ